MPLLPSGGPIFISILVAHRTERGSAGSNPVEGRSFEFDPALPRSVLGVMRIEIRALPPAAFVTARF